MRSWCTARGAIGGGGHVVLMAMNTQDTSTALAALAAATPPSTPVACVSERSERTISNARSAHTFTIVSASGGCPHGTMVYQ